MRLVASCKLMSPHVFAQNFELLAAPSLASYAASMGLNLDDAKLLAEASKNGASFNETLTLGRQQLFFSPVEFSPYLRTLGFTEEKISSFLSTAYDQGPAEPLLKLLGAEQVSSMDFSTYEGASIQHDLNQTIDRSLHERFDLVLDGGTLEHVFNFPVAIRNAMEMVKVGGTLLLTTPANNQVGHGFYQFSPELFFNILSDSNGYQVEKIVAVELSPAHRQFTVADPSSVRQRVTLTNSWPVNLFVHAKRTRKVPLFTRSPQQTDYQAAWHSNTGTLTPVNETQSRGRPKLSPKKRLKNSLLKTAPGWIDVLTTFRQVFLSRQSGFGNSTFFKKR